MASNTLVVNNYYPISYLTDVSLAQGVPANEHFWASVEQLPPASETLIIDFGNIRPTNFLEFDLSMKPVDITIEYDDAETWEEITLVDWQTAPNSSASFIASVTNTWERFAINFELVQTQKFRLTLTRRTDPFPTRATQPFAWSIEMRNLRFMHVMATIDDFVADAGEDILGNGFRTDLAISTATNIVNVPTNFTLGKTNIGGSNTQGGQNFINAAGFYALDQFVTVPNGVVYLSNSPNNRDTKIRLLIYRADPLGKPSSLVAVSEEITLPAHAGPQWWVAPFATAPALTPGNYWIAAWVGAEEPIFYYDTVVGSSAYVAAPYGAGRPPDPFGTANIISFEWSMYLNLTPQAASTVWESQPCPSRNCVEALYFDLRTNAEPGTMTLLDQARMSDLDLRAQRDLELFYPDGVILDEIFIDPITYGPSMHIYYSLDDTTEWDDKLWIPVPIHYVLKKGFFAFTSPTLVKYVKLEFTNLSPRPYNAIDWPAMRPVKYRRYPTWVINYFAEEAATFLVPPGTSETVRVDPLTLGFLIPSDNHDTHYEAIRADNLVEASTEHSEVHESIVALLNQQVIDSSPITSQINFYTPIKWQQDLIQQLDTKYALNRVVTKPRDDGGDATGWNSEQAPPVAAPVIAQSVRDLTNILVEKSPFPYYFPIPCRHGYQIAEAERSSKIAYYVSIRSVSFHRRDYTAAYDEVEYFDRLNDTTFVANTDFSPQSDRYIILP
jgi:hypothetical protein